jgi:predicted transcriptional regulator
VRVGWELHAEFRLAITMMLAYDAISDDLIATSQTVFMPESGDDMPIEAIGARIKRLRQNQKLAQDRLAIEAHLDQSGLSKFERGTSRSMSEAAIRRIAAVLEVSFDELVHGTDFELR